MNQPEASSSVFFEETPITNPVVREGALIWNEWRARDHTQQYALDIESRRQLASKCSNDAEVCSRALELCTGPEYLRRDLVAGVRDLRLNALFLVPEEVTNRKIDEAIDLSIDMVKERRSKGWSADDMESYVKLYDLQHLIAFWEASLGEREMSNDRRQAARAILGASIVDSAEDVERLIQASAAIDVAANSRLAGKKAQLDGHTAEFLLLTVTRLNLLFQGRLDELVLRSAISMEDSNNSADTNLSADMTVHAPHQNAVRFVQCKSGKTGRGRVYAPQITKVLVDWGEVVKHSEMVLFMLRDFTDATNKYTQEDIIQELNRLMGLDKRVGRYDNPGTEALLSLN